VYNVRLGYNVFGSLVWKAGEQDVWVLLVSRVCETSSEYAIVCTNDALKHSGLAVDPAGLMLWSDGPRQFKSLEMLANCIHLFESYPTAKHVFNNYGGPCHWKGPWDRLFGILNRLISKTAKRKKITTIEQVVAIWERWAEHQHRTPD